MAIQKSEGILLRRQDLRETSLILTFYTKDFGKIKGIVRGVRGPHAQYGGGSLEIFAYDELVFYERSRSEFYTVSQCDLLEFFNPIRESLERLAYGTYIVELLDSVTNLADKNLDVFELLLNSLKLLAGESSAKRVTRIFEIKLLHLLGLMPTLAICANCGGPLDLSSKLRPLKKSGLIPRRDDSLDEGSNIVTGGKWLLRGFCNGLKFSLHHGGLICKGCTHMDKEARSILPGTVKFIEHIRNSPFEKVARIKVSATVGKELESILRKFLDYHIERRLRTVEFLKEIEKAI